MQLPKSEPHSSIKVFPSLGQSSVITYWWQFCAVAALSFPQSVQLSLAPVVGLVLFTAVPRDSEALLDLPLPLHWLFLPLGEKDTLFAVCIFSWAHLDNFPIKGATVHMVYGQKFFPVTLTAPWVLFQAW